jgi:hypothetical protein
MTCYSAGGWPARLAFSPISGWTRRIFNDRCHQISRRLPPDKTQECLSCFLSAELGTLAYRIYSLVQFPLPRNVRPQGGGRGKVILIGR